MEALNLPDSKQVHPILHRTLALFGISNWLMSPISEMIVAAILSPIPGTDLIHWYSSKYFARKLIFLVILIDALDIEMDCVL